MLLWQSLAPAVLIVGMVALFLHARNSDSNVVRLLVCAGTAALLIRYTYWRTFYTLEPFKPTFASVWYYAFYISELVMFASGLLALLTLSRTKDRSQEATDAQAWLMASPPSIDMMIATYNEERDILERTIVGARSQDYPNFRVFVLDDGERDWLKQLCDELGVGYITRTEHSHAKSGNMNNAVEALRRDGTLGELIAVLDADFVAQPQFLRRAAALFHDPKVGIVQTPQHFFNSDPLQHTFGAGGIMPDEQRFFFDVVLPSRDAWNTAFCCGTSSICRRSALMDVGGFPIESITEDMLLTMKMKSEGWKTVYLAEKLSFGLAPEGLSEYITQRGRWCIGFMQIFQGAWGPFKRNGLGLFDRISMVDSFLFWTGTYVFRLFCIFVPTVYWFTGVTVINAHLTDLLYYLAPSVLSQIFTLAWLSKGRVLPIVTDASQTLVAIDLIKAAAIGLLRPRNQKFKVTDKGGDRSRVRVHWHLLRRFFILLALMIAGMAYGYYDGRINPDSSASTIGLFWSYYSFIVLSIAMMTCIELPREKHELFGCNETVSLVFGDRTIEVTMTKISLSAVVIDLAGNDGFAKVDLRIEGVSGPIAAKRASSKGSVARYEIEPDQDQRAQLIRKVFSSRYVDRPEELRANAIYWKLAQGFFRT